MIAQDRSWIPGLRLLRTYRREWLPSDVIAGLSVAAVALPVAIAYARLMGFPAVVGIYSSIFPLVAYALFGSSRHLIVNPDAATCAIVAAKPPKWLLLDAASIPFLDTTGADTLEELRSELLGRGTVLAIAGAKGLFRRTLEGAGAPLSHGPCRRAGLPGNAAAR